MSANRPEQRLTPDDWAGAIADSSGCQIVVAGPGAGKSEFLVRRAAVLLESGVTPDALVALTFSRRAAADLKARIVDRSAHARAGLGVSTFHAFAYRFLERHAPTTLGWPEMPTILTGPEQVALVAELLAAAPPGAWPISFRDMLATRTLAAEVTDFILRARERLLTTADLIELASDRTDWRALPEFVVSYDAALRSQNRIDYGTLQAAAVSLFDDPAVHRASHEQFSHVLVDEYQDTTVAQATLLRGLSAESGNITVAADPYQSIYSFRGAELSNVADFPDRFRNLDGSPARRWVLATSMRVPADILRAAERVTQGGELAGSAGPVEPAAHAGRVDIHLFDQQSEEADWIASEVNRLRVEEGVPYARMAVVVRTKRRLLAELSRALGRRDIPHDQPDSRLADHPAAQMLFDIARAAAVGGGDAATPSIRRLLLGPLFSIGIGEQRALERRRVIEQLSWADVIADHVENGKTLSELIGSTEWLDASADDAFWHIWQRLPQLVNLVADPAFGEHRAAWTSLAQALGRFSERSTEAGLLAYIALAESDDFEASPLLSFREPGLDRLALTTLHQVKGIEFDVVFIADAVEGTLPDLRRRQSLLQTERLNPELDPDPAAIARRRLQEEMRLVYTAMTRARHRVVWTATTAGIDEGHRRPSRFLAAIAGDELAIGRPDRRTDNPVTPREAEAWLRTILTDPAEVDARRLAAAHVLCTAPPTRSPETFALVRERGRDTGLIPEGAALSPSQAESFDRCGRRYALERRLHIGDPPSYYMTFGLLIHRILELVETTAQEEGRRSTLDEALVHLDDLFDHEDFGTGSWRDSWRRRATELLSQLYAGWPHPDAIPALLEHPLALDIDGTEWRGVADRIERNPDGTLRVVDYKTSKNPPPKGESESSIQLGYYLLAATFDDAVGAVGRPTAAEYWHPLARHATRRVTPFDPTNIEDVRERLVGIAEGIRSEDWTPTPGDHCRTCPVRLVCPSWPEGQEAYVR